MTFAPVAARTGRYAIVGAICAATYNVVMILGDWAGAHYALSAVASFAITAPLGYLLHVGFTFRERACWRGFARFASGLAAGFPISLAIVAILCSGARLPAAIAAPVATVVLFFWNYASAHWAILGRPRSYRPRSREHGPAGARLLRETVTNLSRGRRKSPSRGAAAARSMEPTHFK